MNIKKKHLFPHRRTGEDTAPRHSGRVIYRDRRCIVRRLWRWRADLLADAEEPDRIYATLPNPGKARKTRYAGMDGHRLSALSFDQSSPFREGFACVGLQGQGYGYLDRDLNLAIAPRYDRANPFSDGAATARRDGCWYLVDRQGNETPLDPAYRRVEPFCEGLCRATTMELDRLDLAYYEEHWPIAGLWGYVDTSGREIAAPQYIFAHDFDGGIAIAAKGEWTQDERWDNQYRQNGWWSEEIRWGGIDTHGREVIPFVFDDIDFFFDRTDCFLAHAGDWDGGHWGVIDRQGHWLAAPEFTYIDPDSHGSLFVFSDIDPDDHERTPHYGIYDMAKGQILFTPQFLYVNFLSGSLFQAECFAPALGRSVEQIFRLDGSVVFPSAYSYIFSHHDLYIVGLERNVGDLRGLIDRRGRVVLPCEYDVPPLGFCHKTQRFIFRQGGKYGVKDYSGHTVWPAVYDRIHSLDAPFPVVGHQDREWPVTARGKPILPNTYESVHWFSDKRHFCTRRDGICEMYVVQER